MQIVIFLVLIALAKFIFSIGWEVIKAALSQVGIEFSNSNPKSDSSD